MSVKSQLYAINLLSHDDDPHWKVKRYPFTDAGAETLAVMHPGFLVKFNATGDAVLPALAADDAVLAGIIIDKGGDLANPDDTTVAVALSGSFNQRQIHYADAHAQPNAPTPLSVAAFARLRDMNIFLDPSVPSGAFQP